MWASFGSLSVAAWILFAQMSWDVSAVPAITAAQTSSEVAVEVRDGGEVFSHGAERQAREVLGRIYRQHRTPIRIETVRTLDGAWIADVAGRRARMARSEQIYILAAGSERDVGVIAARHGPASRLTDQQRESIRRAFLGPLQDGKGDEAIGEGIQALGAMFDEVAPGPRSSNATTQVVVAILLVMILASLAFISWRSEG